jgi:hypothetical protein
MSCGCETAAESLLNVFYTIQKRTGNVAKVSETNNIKVQRICNQM